MKAKMTHDEAMMELADRWVEQDKQEIALEWLKAELPKWKGGDVEVAIYYLMGLVQDRVE